MDSYVEQEVSLADMAASYCGAGITDLVLGPCCAQAVTRNLPMSAISGTTREWFYGLDCWINQHNLCISQN
jgi:hypothetical protein